MTDLARLTTRLRRLGRARAVAAWTRSSLAVVGIALWTLIAAFAMDVLLRMRVVERGVVLAICLGVLAWACWRFLGPVLRRRQSVIAMALLVEHQQKIPSELVAALQFADPTRPQFGLRSLRDAVITDAADLTGGLKMRLGYSWRDFRRPVMIVLTAGLLIALACWLITGHVQAFGKRLLLTDAMYPTRTEFVVAAPGDRVGFGQPVTFLVNASGVLPDEGTATVVGDESGEMTILRLQADPDNPARYAVTWARAIESFTFVVKLGDARSEKFSVQVLPLPKVDVQLDVSTPEYAVARMNQLRQRSRQHAALEGSRVVPLVTADKELVAATIEINGRTFPMTRRGSQFVLMSSDPLLACLSEPLRYQVQVEDTDGLALERPASGVLRVIPDRPPMATCSTGSIQILPTASPTVRVAAADDFGIDRVVLRGTVLREAESGGQTESPPAELGQLYQPGETVNETLTLRLESLGLVVGDRLTCVAEVTDNRGEFPGQSATCPPLIFEIVDRETLLMNLREIGSRMDSRLGDIIKTQGDMGER